MWPDWIDELKNRYLAEEGSVFLLHGPGVGVARWPFEDQLLDAGRLLARFLTLSRDIVVLYDPLEGQLGWGGVQDPGRFKRHTDAAMTLNKLGARPDLRQPDQALGLFWLSMNTAGSNHGLILYHAEKLAPRRRSVVPENLGLGAPALSEWNQDAALRETDNVIVLLAEEEGEVREDLLASVVRIAVPAPPKPRRVMAAPPAADPLSMRRKPIDEHAAAEAANAEIEEALAQASDPEVEDAPSPEGVMAADQEVNDPLSMSRAAQPAARVLDLGELVEDALEEAVIRHADGPPWPHHLPAREAVAAVMHQLAPQRVGALSFEETDAGPLAVGEGADWFNSWWAGDIAVDAACGMALSGLEKPSAGFSKEQPPRFPAAALRALTRRIEKALG